MANFQALYAAWKESGVEAPALEAGGELSHGHRKDLLNCVRDATIALLDAELRADAATTLG